jgi:hypothetical protein
MYTAILKRSTFGKEIRCYITKGKKVEAEKAMEIKLLERDGFKVEKVVRGLGRGKGKC